MKRYFYQKLLSWKQRKKRNPLILIGVRQCGKTYLLKQFGEEAFTRCHYINFEKDSRLHSLFETDLNPQRIIQALNFYLGKTIQLEEDLLIFDEIQACPNALTSLKYFAEEMPELALCSAGSLLGVYLGPISFPVGKVQMMHLQPMTFSEFLMALGDQQALDYIEQCQWDTTTPDIVHEHIWERLKWYFIVGGLPEVVSTFVQAKDNLFEAFEQVREKQLNLIETYSSDMAKHAGKVNAMHLDRIWKAVPSQLARAQDSSTTKFRFKGVVPGVDRYQRLAQAIDWLMAAGLVIKVPLVNKVALPLSAYTSESAFKLYMFDVGLLGALSGLPAKTILEYDYGSYKGYFAENFVAQELKASNYGPYSWQEGRSELEFLVQEKDTIIPIEVKSGRIIKAKSLQKYTEKYCPDFRVIMSARPLNIDKPHGLHQYPLYLVSRFPF